MGVLIDPVSVADFTQRVLIARRCNSCDVLAADAAGLRAHDTLVEVRSVVRRATVLDLVRLLPLCVARCAKDCIIHHALALSGQLGHTLRALAHRGCRLPLLHVVDAPLGDAFLVELRLAAVATDVGEAAQTILRQAHAGSSAHGLLVGDGVCDA